MKETNDLKAGRQINITTSLKNNIFVSAGNKNFFGRFRKKFLSNYLTH